MPNPKPIKPQPPVATTPPAYAELHCLSNFSFQRGAVAAGGAGGAGAPARAMRALAITDECSVAGVVRRAWRGAARGAASCCLGRSLRCLTRLRGWCGGGRSFTVVVLPHNLQGWGNLCEFITRARMGGAQGASTGSPGWAQPDASPCGHTLTALRGAAASARCYQNRSCLRNSDER